MVVEVKVLLFVVLYLWTSCILLYCSTHTLQVSCQTGEDSAAREVQTDSIKTMDRWVQWPPEDLKGWGCDNSDEDDDIATRNDATNSLLSDKDAMGLTKFLQSASQVRASYSRFS